MAESSSQQGQQEAIPGGGDSSIVEKESKLFLKDFYSQLFIEKLELEKMLSESAEAVLSDAVLNMMKEESSNNNLTMIADHPLDVRGDDKQVLDQIKDIDKVLQGQQELLQTMISNVDREIQKYRIEESILVRKSEMDSD